MSNVQAVVDVAGMLGAFALVCYSMFTGMHRSTVRSMRRRS